MCGISGFIGKDFDRNAISASILEVHKSLAHRGPDCSAVSEKSGPLNLIFGHHRLAIQDLNSNADQPMKSPSGSLLVFNGEIYNGQELRNLIGDKWLFKSSGDTEILLALLEIFGERYISKIEGIFAFAFANSDNSELILGRDRLGIKPLYWLRNREGIWFASESKALGRTISPALDIHAFHEWAVFQFPVTNRTFYSGVSSIPAGHFISIKPSGVRVKRFWNIEDHLPGFSNINMSDLTSKLKEALHESVKSQMVSDVSVASFNSGGMDSSAITSIAAKYGLAESFVGTYSFPNYSEFKYAKLVAENAGLPLTEIRISSSDYFEALPKVINALDFPVAGPGAIGQYLVSSEISKRFKVALSGSGGDELFLGYSRDRLPLISALLRDTRSSKLPQPTIVNTLLGDTRSLNGYESMANLFTRE